MSTRTAPPVAGFSRSASRAAARTAIPLALLALTASSASADVVYLSRSWEAAGSGRLVDPGFPDLSGSYTDAGTESANRSLLTLRNFPDFSSNHNWLNQTIIAGIDDPLPGSLFHLQTRGTVNLNGPGVAAAGESMLRATATILVTGQPAKFATSIRAVGSGLTVGTAERTARMAMSPVGGPPIFDETTSSAHDDRHELGSSGFLTLEPGTYELLIELTYRADQADVIGRSESLASAWIQWAIPAPGGTTILGLAALGAARRRR